MDLTRRRLLSGLAGTAGVGTLAGCISDGSSSGSDSGETVAEATFFVFGDITAKVAGDTSEGNLLVPIGQHGHGWEPGASVRADIRDADLLVHGMEGFQPWVDDIRSDLEADDAGVATVDASAGLDLLAAGDDHDHEDGDHEEDDHDHEEDEHDHEEGDHEEDEHDHEEGDHEEGDHEEDDHEEGDHEEDDHDHGSGMDPHFWMDPLRVKEAVGTVRQGFVDADPDNADAYAGNAEEFRSELDDLHGRIESLVADASKGVILVAGHNSWQYFADRYGIEVQALTNVSPDDRPTLQDIEQAQEVIDTHDLEYICADPLESQQAATQLVEETGATEVLSLTALPGLTDEWDSEGWGYIEVMENVNLPALERALDV